MPYWQPSGSHCALARRTGAPGAKTERAWRHGGPGLRAWRRLGRLQCAGRRLQLFFSALGAVFSYFQCAGRRLQLFAVRRAPSLAISSLLACWRRQRQMA